MGDGVDLGQGATELLEGGDKADPAVIVEAVDDSGLGDDQGVVGLTCPWVVELAAWAIPRPATGVVGGCGGAGATSAAENGSAAGGWSSSISPVISVHGKLTPGPGPRRLPGHPPTFQQRRSRARHSRRRSAPRRSSPEVPTCGCCEGQSRGSTGGRGRP